MTSTRFQHGKVTFRWCDSCSTLLLGKGCDRCGSPGREFQVSTPGDIRPALKGSEKVIKDLLTQHFGSAEAIQGRLIFLNKVAGEDRTDEIVVGGRDVGTLRYDLRQERYRLELRFPAAELLGARLRKGIVVLKPQAGHLNGKNISGSEVLEVHGRMAAGDPIIALCGNLVCTGEARVAADEMRTAPKAVHIREAGKFVEAWRPRPASFSNFVSSNVKHIQALESKGVSDIKSFANNSRLPVTLSFSGGKDSLACYGLVKKAVKEFSLIFVNTGLEFPETVEYVQRFTAKNGEKMSVADAGNAFWEQVGAFGPPAKDFRWCCKVCKLAPLTELIEKQYANGTVTVEGNRVWESFARSDLNFVESNPFVPNQVILNPIREWRAAEVWAYIWWKGLDYNPLYEMDMERIGCYLCPACLGSEWKGTASIQPELHAKWDEYLKRWSQDLGANEEFVRLGFWRWKVLPAKMRRLAEEIDLMVPQARADRLQLRLVKGISPCVTGGYSVEGVISVPVKRPFGRVAETLKAVGKTRYSDDYEIALTKVGDSTVKAFGGGQVVATARTPEAASRSFEAGVKAFLRAQMCTMCGICAKNCRSGAITLKDGPIVDEEKCTHCGRCVEACVVAHYYDKLVSAPGA